MNADSPSNHSSASICDICGRLPPCFSGIFLRFNRGKSEIAVGRQAKLFLLVSRIAPRFVNWGLSRWLLKHFPDAPVLRTQRVNTAE